MTAASNVAQSRAQRLALLPELLGSRILILDGAMGTMIQRHRLDEAGYRGERFAAFGRDLKGNNDLLTLTQPGIIRDIHAAYLEAGADIVETNTFNSTSVSQADYGLESAVHELNYEGARLARAAADEVERKTGTPRFVAGVLGPTNRTASISPDVNRAGFRNVTFDELVAAYLDATHGLVEGGADMLLIETVFDTLNCKAAIFAVEEYFERHRLRLPLMISGTITDASGRIASGQTPEAFWNSIGHAQPLSVGLNCALGAEQLRQYVEEVARVAGVPVSVHPNAGLPNAFGGYDDTPEYMAGAIREWAESGFLNIVGGCCGTTPAHIKAIADAVGRVRPRALPAIAPACRLAGLEPLNIGPDSLFVNVGERTNVTGSAAFKKLILNNEYDKAVEVARQQVENGAQVIDVNMDEAMLDGEAAMSEFLRLIASEPGIARVPVMVDSSKWSVIEAGLKCLQGKGVVNSISLKEGEEKFLAQAKLCRRYGAAVVVMAFDENGQAGYARAQDRDLHAHLPPAHGNRRVRAAGHHFRPEHLRHRHRHRRTRELCRGLYRGHALDKTEPAARADFRRRVERVVFVPRQQRRARGDPLGVPVSRHPGRHEHGHRERRPARYTRTFPSNCASASKTWC